MQGASKAKPAIRVKKAQNLILTSLNLILLPLALKMPKRSYAQSHWIAARKGLLRENGFKTFFTPERTSSPPSLICMTNTAAENSCWEKAPPSKLAVRYQQAKTGPRSVSLVLDWEEWGVFSIQQTTSSFSPHNKISQLRLPLKSIFIRLHFPKATKIKSLTFPPLLSFFQHFCPGRRGLTLACQFLLSATYFPLIPQAS